MLINKYLPINFRKEIIQKQQDTEKTAKAIVAPNPSIIYHFGQISVSTIGNGKYFQ